MPLKLNGFTAHICCDDKELEAYGVQKEGGQVVSCWIASEAGKVRRELRRSSSYLSLSSP